LDGFCRCAITAPRPTLANDEDARVKILGISDGMNGGAALIEDGRLTFAVQEERLIRAKMATGFPRQSIATLLEGTATEPRDVTAIGVATVNEFFREPAVAYDGWLMREQTALKELLLNVSSGVTRFAGASPLLKRSYYRLKGLLGEQRRRAIRKRLRGEWGFTCPIHFVNHHFAHACSAFFTSGLGEATVITMDGAGDNSSSHVYAVRAGCFQMLWNVDSLDSIGNYYAYVTHICGFRAQKDEGKITGLAAYGRPTYLETLKKFMNYEEPSPRNKGRVFYWAAVRALKQALPDSLSERDLARSMQELLEEACSRYVGHWVDRTGCRHVALAGGVFANVKLNQRIHQLENVDSVFIHPGMGDEGLAVGAAFALASRVARAANCEIAPATLRDVYLGPSYTEGELQRALDKAGLRAERVPNIEQRIARLLADGHVVARFDGRMEYGPRALGNRSILYQATDPAVHEWLNKKLKRTEFMPFAPVTLQEFAHQCYRNIRGAEYPARFMTITFDCTDWMRTHCPAVVHVDGTARPQLIARDANQGYYQIVDEYRKLTDLPSVINTSFNIHDEPIVCSPSDALRAFKDADLDYLALGNYLLRSERD
jgi:carbamoyltransferase